MQNNEISALLGLSGSSSSTSMYRVLYCLQIIQSLVFEYKQRQQGQVVAHLETQPDKQQQKGAVAEPKPEKMDVDNYDKDFPGLDDENIEPDSP
jgi:hypothetical protein